MRYTRIKPDSNKLLLEEIRRSKWDPLIEAIAAQVTGTLVLQPLEKEGWKQIR